MHPGRVMLDVGGQQARIHAAKVLGEIHEVEPGLDAEHQRALAQLEIQIHQQSLLLGGAVDQDGKVGGQGCGARRRPSG